MLLLIVIAITSLELVAVEGERCGINNLGFRCQDDGVCWDNDGVDNLFFLWILDDRFFRSLFAMGMSSVLMDRTKEVMR